MHQILSWNIENKNAVSMAMWYCTDITCKRVEIVIVIFIAGLYIYIIFFFVNIVVVQLLLLLSDYHQK